MGADRKPSELTAREVVFAILAFVSLALLFFGANLRSWFVVDDLPLIHLAGTVARSDPLVLLRPDIGIYWRPLGKLLFALDAAIWGTNPLGFHLTNVLLHAACTVLVFVLAMRLYGSRAVAWASGVIFAVHPIHHGAVNWISARYDLLCALFVLAGLIAAVGYVRTRSRAGFGLAVLFQLLALFSKELGFVFPLLLALVPVAMSGPPIRDRVRRTVPLFIASCLVLAAVLAVRLLVMGRIGGGEEFIHRGPIEGIAYVAAVLALYMHVPVINLADYSGTAYTLLRLGLLAFALLTFGAWVRGPDRVASGAPFLMALAACIPFSPFVQAGRELDNAYMFYLPSALVAVGWAAVLFGPARRPWFKALAAVLIVAVFPAWLFVNNADYRDAADRMKQFHDQAVVLIGDDPPPTRAYVVGVPRRLNGFYLHFGDLTGYFAGDYGLDRVRVTSVDRSFVENRQAEPGATVDGRVVRVFDWVMDPGARSRRLVERTGDDR